MSPTGAGRGLRRLVVVPLAVAASGCFGYVPSRPDAIAGGQEVRLVLEDEGRARMARTYGWDQSLLLGRFDRVTRDSISVAVRIGRPAPGTVFGQTRQIVTMARSEVEQVEQPELNRARTVLVGAAAAAVGGIVLRRMLQVESGAPGRPQPPGTDSPSVVPSFILFSVSY